MTRHCYRAPSRYDVGSRSVIRELSRSRAAGAAEVKEVAESCQFTCQLGRHLKSVDAPRLLLSVAEVALMLRCGRTKAYEIVKSGQLPVVRIGRSVRVPAAGLEEWVHQQTVDRRRP
jgi:excisionase family DNA binding protein